MIGKKSLNCTNVQNGVSIAGDSISLDLPRVTDTEIQEYTCTLKAFSDSSTSSWHKPQRISISFSLFNGECGCAGFHTGFFLGGGEEFRKEGGSHMFV